MIAALFLDAAVYGVALPLGIALLVVLGIGWPWRMDAGRLRLGAGATAVTAAFIGGFIALFGVPRGIPPHEHWQWIFHVAVIAGVAGIVDARPAKSIVRAVVLRAYVCIPAAWILVPHFVEAATSRYLWIALLSLIILAIWSLLHWSTGRLPGAVILLALTLTASVSALVHARYGANMKFCQLCGALAAGLGGALLISLWRDAAVNVRSIASVFAFIVTGLAVNGSCYASADVSEAMYVLTAVAAGAVAIGAALAGRKAKRWTAGVISLIATAIPLLIAVYIGESGYESSLY